MISTESFEASWIDSKSKELQYNDKNIIEKVIRAFSLLEMLAKSGCPFHFKGVDNLEVTTKAFSRIAEVELSYRGYGNTPKIIFEDVRQTALCLATRGVEGQGNFTMLQQGVSRIKSFMFQGGYVIDNAIIDAARAAYVATLIENGITAIERYDGNPMSIANLSIQPSLTSKLNKLKRQSPEAFYYWAMISRLLK